ncbi:MAG: PAS domain-containing protein [Calothrix sp. FI2-JRJ7]|jgi:hypothetical protein|nr:PAS domain-containing protein [Calothrix sp. FI2-JRJ7]
MATQQDRTILIISDCAEDRVAYRHCLLEESKYNYRILEAESTVGLTLCCEAKPDCVLLNFIESKIGGFEFISNLQALTGKSYLPALIGITEYRDEMADACNCSVRNLVSEYLVKTSSPDTLRIAVRSAIEINELRHKLQASVARFRTSEQFELAAEAVNCLIFDSDLQTNIVERTRGLMELVGYASSEAEPTAQWWRQLIHPDDINYINDEKLTTILESKHRYTNEYRVRHKQGYYVWVQEQGIILRDANGQPVRVVGSTVDITRRKQAEEALQRSEEKLAFVLNNVDASISRFWIFPNQDWKFDYYSPGCEKIFGYMSQELLQDKKLWLSRVAPSDLENVILPKFKDIFVEQTVSYEYRFYHKDGSLRWINDTLTFQYDKNENAWIVTTIAVDITERKQVIEALWESTERYRYVVETVPNIVWRACSNGNTDFVNHRWVEYTGCDVDQALGTGWLQFIHPDDVLRVQAFWQSTTSNIDSLYEIQYRLKYIDGTYRWNLVRGYPIIDEQGNVIKWYGSCTDIHDQKELEAQRNQLLVEAQAAREEAELANRTKDEFLAIVSHELRSPLNAILGWTKLLRTRNFDQANTARALEIIERNTVAQVQLIEDLLDISRMIRGNLRLTLQPVNLATIIETGVNNLRLSADAKKIDLQMRNYVRKCLVLGDMNRLQQIVSNLLTNAIKFTPSLGRVEICLEIVNHHTTQIRVTDTGKGISADFLPYIFERFRQAENTTTRAKDGLGLGLAIVRHLVELHNGAITASSLGEGQGATFTVTLPLLQQEATRQEGQEEISSTLLSNKKILVVDDEPDNCTYLSCALEEYGATVKAASCAKEALAVFEEFQPDIIISDIGMPEEDGHALIRKIRQLTTHSCNIPAIALTAYTKQEDRERSRNAGFQLHMTKPVEPAELIKAISNLIE